MLLRQIGYCPTMYPNTYSYFIRTLIDGFEYLIFSQKLGQQKLWINICCCFERLFEILEFLHKNQNKNIIKISNRTKLQVSTVIFCINYKLFFTFLECLEVIRKVGPQSPAWSNIGRKKPLPRHPWTIGQSDIPKSQYARICWPPLESKLCFNSPKHRSSANFTPSLQHYLQCPQPLTSPSPSYTADRTNYP